MRENLDFTYDHLKKCIDSKTLQKLNKFAKQLSVHSSTRPNSALSVIKIDDFKKVLRLEDASSLQGVLKVSDKMPE